MFLNREGHDSSSVWCSWAKCPSSVVPKIFWPKWIKFLATSTIQANWPKKNLQRRKETRPNLLGHVAGSTMGSLLTWVIAHVPLVWKTWVLNWFGNMCNVQGLSRALSGCPEKAINPALWKLIVELGGRSQGIRNISWDTVFGEWHWFVVLWARVVPGSKYSFWRSFIENFSCSEIDLE